MKITFLPALALSAGLALSPVMAGIAAAQAPQGGSSAVHHHKQKHRNPVKGDRSASTDTHRNLNKMSPDARANAIVNSDVQSPNTQNGNQVDRAAAAAGGR